MSGRDIKNMTAEILKKCNVCCTLKPLSEFYKDRGHRDGHRCNCKKCFDEKNHKYKETRKEENKILLKKWYINNKEKVDKQSKEWKKNNRERYLKSMRDRHKLHPEIKKENAKRYYLKHPERVRAVCDKWRFEHKERTLELAKKYTTKARSTSRGRLNNNMASSIRHSIGIAKNNQKWESLVGYTVDRLKAHIENLFTPKMNWENWGTFWELDHKIPISVHNYSSPEDIDFKKCWALSNLQPLERIKNRKKHNKLETPFQPSLLIQERNNS
jgi:hypothetical protein